MNISAFSFMMSVLSGTVFILAIHFLRGRESFLRAFGAHTILVLYGFCLVRMIFPIETPFTVHIVFQGMYSRLLAALSGTLLPDLLCGLWIAVAAAIFLHFLWEDFRVNKELAPYHQNSAPRAEKILERIQRTSPRRTAVSVCLCPDIDVPMGAGLIRRRIYLPDEEYTDKELYYILKHEYTHFCNHDLISKFMVKILCCVFWWNPAVYILKKDISQILEIQCDINATQGFTKQERLEYLMTILRVVGGRDSAKGKPPSMLATGMLFDTGRRGLRERFTLLTKEPLAAPGRVLAVFWALSGAAMVLSYSVVFQPGAVQPRGARATVSDKMNEEMISFLISGVLWLFVLIQIKYQLFRNKGRSILALTVAALLCGTMALYMGNIQSTQKAIDALADTIPVKVNVVNRTGNRRTELFIEPQMLDGLSNAGVKDVFATAEAVGAWSESAKAQEPFFSGDVNMAALNHIRAWEGVDEDKLEWMPGRDGSVFGTDQAVCVLTEQCAARFGVELGGEVSVAVYAVRRNSLGISYELIEDAAFQVAGIYRGGDSSVDKDMHITTGWMRAAAQRKGTFFSYDSAVCQLADARRLNEFKAELPRLGFMEPFEGADNLIRGDAVTVDDEMFIKTGQNLKRNLETFQSFLAPFFLLIVCLVTLTTFLMLRGSRREMAIASSLGQSKWQTAFSNFASTVLAYMVGCAIMVPSAALLAGVSVLEGAAVCGLFLLCAALGVALALAMLLRFDTLTLLTRAD